MGWEEFKANDESPTSLTTGIDPETPYAKPGKPAQYPFGVAYVGAWETQNSGVPIAVRRHAVALSRQSMPVFLQSESFTHQNMGVTTSVEYFSLPPIVLAEVGSLTVPKHEDSAVLIRHTVPTLNVLESIAYPQGLRFMPPDAIMKHRARTVVFAAFEENVIPKAKVKALNMIGQIWTPSRAAAKWLKGSGVVESRIRVIPHPFYGKDPVATLNRVQKFTFRFLNVSKWEPRKGQHDLIGGFLMFSSPEANIELVIKSSPFCRAKDYPRDWVESIQTWLSREEIRARGWTSENVLSRVKVLWKKDMDRASLAKLYAECDCYVSAGRSEGFDLPTFDAALCGMKILRADNGGPDEYLEEQPVFMISRDNRRSQFHPWYGFSESTWDDYDAADVAAGMQKVFQSGEESIVRLNRERFTLTAVGKAMRAACEEVAPELREVRTT